ncbi:MAG: SIS domain-containing protein [Promethearchaeota archaeon]
MKNNSGSEISAFKSAYQLLIRTAKRSVNTINQEPHNLALFCKTLSNALEDEDKVIHVAGVGLSKQIGMILGESLKNIGFSNRVSYLGDVLALPIKKDDVMIAITGSGWTTPTTTVLEEAVWKKAKVLTFTGFSDSKAAKLSEATIQSPLGFKLEDQLSPYTSKPAPLSPLGTIFELTTFIIGLGIINGVYKGSCTKGFNEGTNNILKAAEQSFENLTKEVKLFDCIKVLSDYYRKSKSKIFFYGNGLEEVIVSMCSSRFQSLGMNIHSMADWRFRREKDLLIVFSGSGDSPITSVIIESAKTSGMFVFGITSFPQSRLALKSDNFLIIQGRKERIDNEKLQLIHSRMYLPIFEYIITVTLEAIIAQLVVNLGIPET